MRRVLATPVGRAAYRTRQVTIDAVANAGRELFPTPSTSSSSDAEHLPHA